MTRAAFHGGPLDGQKLLVEAGLREFVHIQPETVRVSMTTPDCDCLGCRPNCGNPPSRCEGAIDATMEVRHVYRRRMAGRFVTHHFDHTEDA